MARQAMSKTLMKLAKAVESLPQKDFVVAYSGGADSLALAAAAKIVAAKRGSNVRVLNINHNLQEDSQSVSRKALAEAAKLGLDGSTIDVSVEMHGDGVEAAAREARYAALFENTNSTEIILLGHTMNDQAETVLLGLSRGSGSRSLSGMPKVRDNLYRPLLEVTREETLKVCAELGLDPWSDPHNESSDYTRVRVRSEVIPLLERTLSAQIVRSLSRTAEMLREDSDFLDDLAFKTLSPETETLDCVKLSEVDWVLRSRIIKAWLEYNGALNITSAHVKAINELVDNWRGQKFVLVSGGIKIVRTRKILEILVEDC